MRPVSYYVPTEFSSPKFAFAFAKGCKGAITDENALFDGPVALFGSPSRFPLLRQAQTLGRDWYYGDHGYFGDVRSLRKRFYRITKNGYQHDGRGDATPERYGLFVNRQIKPWRTAGSHILVCPNSAVYFGLHGMNVDEWLIDVRQQLAAVTDRPIRIRWKVTATPIEQDLEDCWAVVVYSSSSAIDGLIGGVPCVTLAPFASTVRMGLTSLADIEQPFYPNDRDPFMWNLAHQQWSLKEIFSGQAWRTMQEQPS